LSQELPLDQGRSDIKALPLDILVVEDTEEGAHPPLDQLRSAGFDVRPKVVRTAAAFEDALAERRWRAVIADVDTSTLPGMVALRILRATGADIPFILTSPHFVEEIGLHAIEAGANAYVTKDRLGGLGHVMERELREAIIRAAHRKAQRDLADSEERFRSLTALSSDWFWEQDESLRFTYISESSEGKYSEALEAWAGKSRWELPYRNTDWTAHRALIEARQSFLDVELQPFRHDGREVYVSISGEPKLDARGRFIGYRGVGKDITERVRGAQALRGFRTALDATADAITLVSRESMLFVEVNTTVTQMLGYSRSELLTMGPMDVSSVSREQAAAAYDSLIAGDLTFRTAQTVLKRKDGSSLPVDVRQHAQRVGDAWIIVGVVRDHSERQEAEDKLKQLNRLYATISATNALVMRVHNRDDLFKAACNVAVDVGEFEQAWIGILDPGTNALVPRASTGFSSQAFGAVREMLLASGDINQGRNFAARAVREKEVLIANDVRRAPDGASSDNPSAGGMRSVAFLPLVFAGRATGVFVLSTSQPHFFEGEGLGLLKELAGNVAFAIDHLEKQDRLDYLAYYDELTGLANRRLFLDRATQYVRSAAAADQKLALCLFDLERFKKINDTLGRSAGDELLRLVAQWMVQNAGDVNAMARVDADHFALLLPQVTDEADVARALEKYLAELMGQAFTLDGAIYRIAAKVGVSLFPDDGADADTLFRNAEVAVKKAKVGGDRYLFYAQKMTETVAGSLSLENRLRDALEREEFVLYYQPKVNIASGLVTGAEALIRWNDPRSGLVPPGRFIPVLEETGLIHEVGKWALARAIEDFKGWQSAGLAAVPVAVNVSPLQLRNRHFVADIERILGNIPPTDVGLELELTESLVMENVSNSIQSLLAMRALGVTIAIDDFGTGFSSLSYLSKLPVDTLKIDRSFISDMVGSAEGLALVSVIIGLAHALKLKVVAEGVETDEQLRELKLLRCDEMQGYLFARPMPAEIFKTTFLRAARSRAQGL
jgi:diguanylate cyclase (GGDEF)-like protein/PAS domain S-box-containing protein